MQNTATPSSVWQRRTHRLVAATVIFIGLTMMISNISQCIYMGMVFIMLALMWLAWMAMKERKVEPPRPQAHQSPVLFLVTSHMLPNISRSNVANALDKPPSYDTIVSLDGLPPDYSSCQLEKPPRYEEVAALYKAARDFDPNEASPGPSGVGRDSMAEHPQERTNHESLDPPRYSEMDGVQPATQSDNDLNSAATRTRCNNPDDVENGRIQPEEREACSMDIPLQNAQSTDSGPSGTRMSRFLPTRSSLSRSFRMRQDLRKESRERKRNASANDCRNSAVTADDSMMNSTKSLLRLQVPTLSQDIAGNAARYLDSSDTTNSCLPSIHSRSFNSRRSRTLPSTSASCGAPSSLPELGASSKAYEQSNEATGPTTEHNSTDAPQLSSFKV